MFDNREVGQIIVVLNKILCLITDRLQATIITDRKITQNKPNCAFVYPIKRIYALINLKNGEKSYFIWAVVGFFSPLALTK